jgi:hypothetical protein
MLQGLQFVYMKKGWFVLILSVLFSVNCRCQQVKPSFQSNDTLDFSTFLGGVKYAYVVFPAKGDMQALDGIINYLTEIGFQNVKWGRLEDAPSNFSSVCNLVIVNPSWRYMENTFMDFKLSFISCNNDVFTFVSEKDIWVNSYTNISDSFYRRCLKMFDQNILANFAPTLKLPTVATEWTTEKLKSNFRTKGIDKFEGVYEAAGSGHSNEKIGIISLDNHYQLLYLEGATNYLDWKEGELRGTLSHTGTPNIFSCSWRLNNKKLIENAFVTFENGMMNLLVPGYEKILFIKVFPTIEDRLDIVNNGPASGTGFAVSSEGKIVTNSHVVHGSNNILVRGVGGDFTKTYSAIIVIEDKVNDLAILQIEDKAFKTLGLIPYVISGVSSEVGCSVFSLGYPLKSLMGDEIKLTNGIISSKSGFQGDITTYQISVPLQPGNSGGPLFDSNGNLVGIVNSRLSIGENVSYAIKSAYLKNLLEDLSPKPMLGKVNLLKGKSLSEQVKLLNKIVFIIEVN